MDEFAPRAPEIEVAAPAGIPARRRCSICSGQGLFAPPTHWKGPLSPDEVPHVGAFCRPLFSGALDRATRWRSASQAPHVRLGLFGPLFCQDQQRLFARQRLGRHPRSGCGSLLRCKLRAQRLPVRKPRLPIRQKLTCWFDSDQCAKRALERTLSAEMNDCARIPLLQP